MARRDCSRAAHTDSAGRDVLVLRARTPLPGRYKIRSAGARARIRAPRTATDRLISPGPRQRGRCTPRRENFVSVPVAEVAGGAAGLGLSRPSRFPILRRRPWPPPTSTSSPCTSLSRVHPPDKEVLKDISLAFLPGAKIGVLGLNGAGQVDAAADHGRHRHRVPRRRRARARRDGRAARAGAAARRVQGRARQRRGGGRGDQGTARPLQRAVGELLRRDRGRVRAPAGADRRRRRLEPRHPARARDGRAALPARRRRRVQALRRRAPARRAVPAAARAQPDLLLLDEPTNHLDAESVAWLERHLAEYTGTVVAVTHDRYFLDNVAGWILELDRGRGIPFQGNYSVAGSSRSRRASRRRSGEKSRASARSPAELEWVRMNASARAAASPRRASTRYEALLAEERNVKLDQVQIHIPAGPAARRRGGRGRRRCARATATGC